MSTNTTKTQDLLNRITSSLKHTIKESAKEENFRKTLEQKTSEAYMRQSAINAAKMISLMRMQ